MQLEGIAGCIIRASDPETCSIHVVCRAVSFASGQGQRKDMDGATLRRRLLPAAFGIFSEAYFSSPLNDTYVSAGIDDTARHRRIAFAFFAVIRAGLWLIDRCFG
jgi:hypothetical protein